MLMLFLFLLLLLCLFLFVLSHASADDDDVGTIVWSVGLFPYLFHLLVTLSSSCRKSSSQNKSTQKSTELWLKIALPQTQTDIHAIAGNVYAPENDDDDDVDEAHHLHKHTHAHTRKGGEPKHYTRTSCPKQQLNGRQHFIYL